MTGIRIAVTAPPSSGHSGVADYARLLGEELERCGFAVGAPGSHELAILNFTPYGAGVHLGWLRAVREAHSLSRGGQPLITVFHEVFVLPDRRLRMRGFGLLQTWAHRRLVRASSAVVVSDDARAGALAALVPGAPPATVVAVGPNVPVPCEAVQRPGEPLVATFGLPHPLRDLETLVRAAALVSAELPAVRFVFLGDPSGDPAAAAHIRDLALALGSPVELTGALPAAEVAARLAATRVFVSTYTETLSLGSGGLAGALGHGAVVVAYDSARLSPPLLAGKHLLVAPRDPDGLARTIVEALAADADGVGAAGRSLYEEAASWKAIAACFTSLIEDALRRRPTA